MGLSSGMIRFFLVWGLRWLILFVGCLVVLGVPYEKMASLALITLLATVGSEVVARLITGGM